MKGRKLVIAFALCGAMASIPAAEYIVGRLLEQTTIAAQLRATELCEEAPLRAAIGVLPQHILPWWVF